MQITRVFSQLAIAATLAVAASAASAATTVVNFDGIGSGTLADGYGGILWNSNWNVYDSPQSPYTASSGTGRIYTNYALNPVLQYEAVSFSFATAVVFDGAYVAGASDTSNVEFELYYEGNLVGTSASLNQSATPTFLSSGYSGLVDTVKVLGTNGFYVIDDVTYSTSSVPEPANVTLMLGGLLLAAGVARRARKN
jgi:hypothetical protein